MNKYETTFILEPGMDETKVNEEVERQTKWIGEHGGEVLEVQRWGKRRLAYEIGRRRDGIYTMFVWQAPGRVVKDFEHRLKLNEAVMRVLTVMHVPPDLTRPQADPEAVAAATGEDAEE